MTDKYIDLAEKIVDSSDYSNTTSYVLGVKRTLAWLDDNPDQVPGRTITESEFDELVDTLHQNWAEPEYFSGALSDELENIGITVVPAPEPTNAGKATADLETWGIPRARALELGPWLAGQGWVKAPEADDE